MSAKLPAIAYYTYKVRTTGKRELIEELKNAPISEKDFNFLLDIINGFSYKQLADKYEKSEARIYQWKRNLFERLHRYDCA